MYKVVSTILETHTLFSQKKEKKKETHALKHATTLNI